MRVPRLTGALSSTLALLLLAALASADEPVRFYGKVGKSLVSGQLTREGKRCTGRMRYKQLQGETRLQGTLKHGKWKFIQRDSRSRKTGVLEAKWIGSQRLVSGKWKSSDGSSMLPFSLYLEPPRRQEHWQRIPGPIGFGISWEYPRHLLAYALRRDGQTAFRPKTRGIYDRLANEFADQPLMDGPTIVTVFHAKEPEDLFNTLDWENNGGNWQPTGTSAPSRKLDRTDAEGWIGARTAHDGSGKLSGTDTREAVLLDRANKIGVAIVSSTLTEDEFTRMVESVHFPESAKPSPAPGR